MSKHDLVTVLQSWTTCHHRNSSTVNGSDKVEPFCHVRAARERFLPLKPKKSKRKQANLSPPRTSHKMFLLFLLCYSANLLHPFPSREIEHLSLCTSVCVCVCLCVALSFLHNSKSENFLRRLKEFFFFFFFSNFEAASCRLWPPKHTQLSLGCFLSSFSIDFESVSRCHAEQTKLCLRWRLFLTHACLCLCE